MTWHREGQYNVLKSESGEVLGFVCHDEREREYLPYLGTLEECQSMKDGWYASESAAMRIVELGRLDYTFELSPLEHTALTQYLEEMRKSGVLAELSKPCGPVFQGNKGG